jgi:hypothetical protein
LWIIQDALISIEQLAQYLSRLFRTVSVSNTESPVYPPFWFCCLVDQGRCRKAAIGKNDGFIIRCFQNGIKDFNLADSPCVPLCLYKITHLEMLEEQNDDTSGEVL